MCDTPEIASGPTVFGFMLSPPWPLAQRRKGGCTAAPALGGAITSRGYGRGRFLGGISAYRSCFQAAPGGVR